MGAVLIRRTNQGIISGLIIVIMAVTVILPANIEAADQSRPKLGLALGGGSALGFTHIGVLKWLEENRIPVDYIAGTSMGGLIGGLYAMGMNPQEIEELVKSVNWDQLFNSDPPYNSMTFRRKEDQRDYPSEIKLGARDGLFLPNGLSIYQVDFLLSRIALPYATIKSFDELPIPYRCVATDIRSSQAVVLENGSLVEAMRATMSIPGVFVPVEREDQLLVDGGLVNNVPADVAEAMGADKVIAVNCNENNDTKDLRRLDSFLMSTINSVIVNNTRRALQNADIIIHPQVAGVSLMDWKEVNKFITAGYWAAARQGEQLRKFALDKAAWEEHLQQRYRRKIPEPLIPETLEVRGTNAVNRHSIQTALQPLLGKKINPDELEKSLTEVLGSGFFESIRYELVRKDERNALVLTVKEKPYGPPFFGFVMQANVGGGWTDFNLRTRATAFNIWGENSELRVDLGLGTSPLGTAELYKPVGERGWFIAPQIGVEQTSSSLFRDEVRFSDFQINRQAIGLDLGYTINRFAEVRFGYQMWHQSTDTVVGAPGQDQEGGGEKFGLKCSYSRAADKSPLQPGVAWDLKADWYRDAPLADDTFTMAETKLRLARRLGIRSLLLLKTAVGVTLDGEPPFLQQYTLGGPFRLGAYQMDELRGDNYWLGTVGFLTPLGGGSIRGRMFAGVFLETGAAFASWSEVEPATNLTFGLAFPMVLGTTCLGVSFGENERFQVHLTMGRTF